MPSSSLASDGRHRFAAARRAAARRPVQLLAPRRQPRSRARARPLRGAATSIASALARSTSAACAALASPVRLACACIASRASNRRRCAAFNCSSAARCSVSIRAIDCRASSWRASCARSSSSADRRSTAICSCLRLMRSAASVGGPDLQLEADDRPFPAGAARPGATRSRIRPRQSSGRALSTSLAQPLDGGSLGVGALAQLLDLALGREDAARFGARAAFDDVARRGTLRRRG